MKSTQRKTVKTSKTSAPLEVKVAAAAKVSSPTREEIAIRAYELYLARGREDGHDAEDWIAAEAQLGGV
jgi:hypothetical protein